jgi:HKD family nuclease
VSCVSSGDRNRSICTWMVWSVNLSRDAVTESKEHRQRTANMDCR